MEYLRYFGELMGILMGVVGVLFVIGLILHSRRLPECYSCGAMKVRPARLDGLWDTVGLGFQIRPYRCSGCRERFYGFVFYANRSKMAVVETAQPQRLVKITLRFRYGLPNRVAILVTTAAPKSASVTPSTAILEI